MASSIDNIDYIPNLTQFLSQQFKHSSEMVLEPYRNQYQHLLQLRMKSKKANNIVKDRQYFVLTNANVFSRKGLAFYENVKFLQEHHDIDLTSIAPRIYLLDGKIGAGVLQDLEVSGCRKSPHPDLDQEHISCVIKAIAELHAAGYAYNSNNKPRFDRISEIKAEVLKMKRFDIQDERLRQEYKKVLDVFDEDTGMQSVFCHGNLVRENLLFKYDDLGCLTKCKLIGFKSTRLRPPTHDLTYLLQFCTNQRTKQTHYHMFLKEYYLELKKRLDIYQIDIENVLPLHQFELSCAEYAFYAKILKAVRQNQKSNDPKMFDRIISEEDVYYLVQKKIGTCSYTLLDYVLKPMEVKSGFLGEHAYLTVQIRRDNGSNETLKYFVKSLPQTASQREFAIETGGIFKELQMFRRLIPDFEVTGIDIILDCTPRCYLARSNDVFVFDNLKELGYEMVSVREPLNLKTMLLTVECLAKYHAAHLILEEQKSLQLGRKYRLMEDYSKELEETFYTDVKKCRDLLEAARRGLGYYLDLMDHEGSDISKEELRSMAEQFFLEYPTDVLPSKQFRNTICHGDLWTGNLMYLRKNDVITKCMMIDFQSYRYSPPAQDLLAVIYMTSDRALRRDHMPEILEHYYLTLADLMKTRELDLENIISRSEFEASLKHYEKFAISQAVTHMQITPISPNRMKVLFEDPEYCRRSFFEDRTDHLKTCCEEDPVYKSIQLRTQADFKEMCIKMKKNGFVING